MIKRVVLDASADEVSLGDVLTHGVEVFYVQAECYGGGLAVRLSAVDLDREIDDGAINSVSHMLEFQEVGGEGGTYTRCAKVYVRCDAILDPAIDKLHDCLTEITRQINQADRRLVAPGRGRPTPEGSALIRAEIYDKRQVQLSITLAMSVLEKAAADPSWTDFTDLDEVVNRTGEAHRPPAARIPGVTR